MRIGELATLAGVSTRAVRHYHASGVLPDPVRLSNGYRDYGAADLIRLLRVVRLTKIGLTLSEVRSVLTDEQRLRACGGSAPQRQSGRVSRPGRSRAGGAGRADSGR